MGSVCSCCRVRDDYSRNSNIKHKSSARKNSYRKNSSYADDNIQCNDNEYTPIPSTHVQPNHDVINNEADKNYKNQYQTQQQVQIQRQDQMTVRTQLLLDDTQKQIELMRNYLDAAGKEMVNKEELSLFNQKVVLGLTCFNMKVNGMRKNAKKEGLDFSDAFKSSAQIIKEFSNQYKQEFGDNEYLMNRLQPCLNYMHAVLKGSKNIPSLPYINEYEFNKETVSSVMSQVNHAQNHVIPDRMEEINQRSEQYKKEQAQLKQQYEDHKDDDEDVDYEQMNVDSLIQDYNTKNVEFAQDKKEQDAIIAAQQHEFKYGAPDLQNGFII